MRHPPLELDGLGHQELLQKLEEIHENCKSSVLARYDLEEQYKLFQYDILELQERARQMSKGNQGGKRDRSMSVAVGADRLSDKYTNAPPKVEVCSKFDRKTDSRTYDQMRTMFASPLALAVTPGPSLAEIDKSQEIALLSANRNLVGYDKVRIRSGSLTNLPGATDSVNTVTPMKPLKKKSKKKKQLGSIDELDAAGEEDEEVVEEDE